MATTCPPRSHAIAKRLIKNGAMGVTCAKLGEAEEMFKGGVTDILIANQIAINPTKLRRYRYQEASSAPFPNTVPQHRSPTPFPNTVPAAARRLPPLCALHTTTTTTARSSLGRPPQRLQ